MTSSSDFFSNFIQSFSEPGMTSFNFDFSSSLLSILILVEYWLILQKAGEAGWKILIPYYNNYIKFKIAKKQNLFWWHLGLGLILTASITTFFIGFVAFMPMSIEGDGADVIKLLISSSFVWLACGIAMFILKLKGCIGLAKAFGQDVAFGWGLALIEPVFAGLLAFSNNYIYTDSSSTQETDFKEYLEEE